MKTKRGEQAFSSNKFRRITSVEERKLKRKAKRKKGKKPLTSQQMKQFKEVAKVVHDVKPRKSKKKRKKTREQKVQEVRKLQFEQADKEDDKIIKQMEKRLGMKKRKRKSLPMSFHRDGLDYLLDVVEGRLDDKTTDLNTILTVDNSDEDDEGSKGDDPLGDGEDMDFGEDADSPVEEEMESDQMGSDDSDQNFSDGGDDHQDLDNDVQDSGKDSDEKDLEDESDMDDSEGSSTRDKQQARSIMEEVASESEEESNEGSGDGDGNSNSESEQEIESNDMNEEGHESDDDNEKKKDDDGTWEDIYGRKRDKEGNVIQEKKQAYVPPAKRDSKTSESLKRQLKGHLNRLSEANMHSTVAQVERLYSSHSRHDVNETLTQLILEAVCQSTMTPERLVMEHAVLVAAMHGNVGTECGAHILHKVVTSFHEMYKDPKVEQGGKRIHNIIVFFSHLFTFKVCNSSLVYDVLRLLSEGEGLAPLGVELILLVLRSVGFLLRKDDSVKLKDLVVLLQDKASKQKEQEQDSRVNWMLETLLAIRNNNMRNIPQYDPTTAEQLRKVLKAELHKGVSVTSLAVTLEDLLQAETRGRWWVVGSSWTGKEDPAPSTPAVTEDDTKLLKLAKKQRMSTDVRKKIFCAIMGAEDYMNAMERLLKLGLDGSREREILHVIVDCCVQENSYNPYYGFLAQAMCQHHRRFMMSAQFSLWDRIKELDSLTPSQRHNLAQFTSLLLVKQALPLSALKVIEYSELDKPKVRFLRTTLQNVLKSSSDDETCAAIFRRAAKGDKLKLLREGLRLFMKHFLIKNKNSYSEEDLEVIQRRQRIAEDALKGGTAMAL